MSTSPCLALLLLASTLVPAARASDPAALAAARSFPLDRVLHDEPGDGCSWARGLTWKARFGADATTYYPLFGRDAPRHYPLELRVAGVWLDGSPLAFDPSVAPTREGDVVSYRRGSFVERYETRLDSIEQVFVFDELERRGELVIRVSAETELAGREDADALGFENARGRVSYRRAVALDARGVRIDAPTRLTPQGIEIRVPAGFVASARLPLVVDPVVMTYGIDLQLAPEPKIDVAHDETTRTYVHVFSVQSNGEEDVFYARGSSDTLGHGDVQIGVIDITTLPWEDPAVANLAAGDSHLVVATVTTPNWDSSIRGRILAAAGTSLSQQFQISPVGGSFHRYPDVGGSDSEELTSWAVVWNRQNEIVARRVQVDGALSPLIELSLTESHNPRPSISRANAGGWWNVVWSCLEWDGTTSVRARRLHSSGALGAPILLSTTTYPQSRPRASTARPDGTWLAVFERPGLYGDLGSRVIVGDTPQLFAQSYTDLSLQLSWQNGLPTGPQAWPDVDCDGERFVVAYSERVGTGPDQYRVYAATVAMVGPYPEVTEVQQLPGESTGPLQPSVFAHASGGGEPRRTIIGYAGEGARIEGVVYDASSFSTVCAPGFDVGDCPCSNAPSAILRGCDNSASTGGARLLAEGNAALTSDTLKLRVLHAVPNGLGFFMQGDALTSATPFGQGLRCVGGLLQRLYVRPTSAAGRAEAPGSALEYAPVGDGRISARSAELGDPIAPGSTRWYFVLYTDPVAIGDCTSTRRFNATPAIQTVWAP